ncbi:DUF4153 domain-containing protein [Rhizobium sp. Leaf341]|uniref:DUF4153 domain-containing protein n=1 Tax=Rhizobium sp. Leaf341 TaxID=1736344 RepID=UPI0009E7A66C|nr:DUF4173 domain-containing protein [Rhizobium sp. Leaf341]
MLVALSDYLAYGREPGFNLFVLAAGLTVAVLALSRRQLTLTSKLLLLSLSVLGSLPLLETVTTLGIAIATCTVMSTALACSGMIPRSWSRMSVVLIRFAFALPLPIVEACWRQFLSPRHDSSMLAIGRAIALWMLPLTLASVFLVLFSIANPLIEQTIRDIDVTLVLQLFDLWRIGFWLVVATCVWAMLRPKLARRISRRGPRSECAIRVANPLLGHGFLLRSLILFNALFAVQSSLDIIYLWSGANLPDGLTHAEYAHRGAYPLIATALLAAAFMLVTMKRGGPGDSSFLIRGLVFAWIAQNILLCLSSLLRLDLYVGAYSLTEMRVAAGIWMGMVAVGLFLILLRFILRLSNEWLIAANMAVLVCVLYVCALVDLPGVIARFNVLHSYEVSGEGIMLDFDYIASLGTSSIPAVDLYIARLAPADTAYSGPMLFRAQQVRQSLVGEFERLPKDWRSWTFRGARLEAYLQSTVATSRENRENGNRQF